MLPSVLPPSRPSLYPFGCSVPLTSLNYFYTCQPIRYDACSPSPGRKEHNTEQEAAQSRNSPLTPGALRIVRHPSQAYLKTTRRNCLTCWCLQFSEEPFAMIFSTGHVFDSLASCRPIRECFRVKRFIPPQTPASGARRCPVHHRRTYGFGARLGSKVLCCLAYFSCFSNGPLPN